MLFIYFNKYILIIFIVFYKFVNDIFKENIYKYIYIILIIFT